MVTSGQYQRSTGRLPDWYHQQPPAHRGDEVILNAYIRLQTERPRSVMADGSMWTGPIPWSAASRYAEDIGMRGWARGWVASLITALDDAHREHQSEEKEREERRSARVKRRKARLKAAKGR